MQPSHSHDLVVGAYVGGMSIHTVSKTFGIPYGRVRETIVAAGVPLRPRSHSYRIGGAHPSSKLSQEQYDALTQELRVAEKQHWQLAKEYGLTRQRVLQIAQYIKAPAGRLIQRKVADRRDEARAQETQRRREARKQVREERYARWRELWDAGHSLKDMAVALGMTPMSIGVRITELRRTNPGWFPYRRKSAPLPDEAQP